MKCSEIYNEAADLVEKGWSQNAFARNKNGFSVDPGGDGATSWCLSGALWLVTYGKGTFNRPSDYRTSILYKLVQDLKLKKFVAAWNDDPDRTQEDVVKLLRDAAKQADEENKTIGE